MADLYLMDDLKDAAGSLIGTKQTNKHNILEIYELAEKYSNKKLKEMCYQFVFQNLKILNKNQMTELTESLPLLGEKALLELQQTKGRPQNSVDVANKVLGITLGDPFKKRRDFQSVYDYKGYVMSRIEPNMLVAKHWDMSEEAGGRRWKRTRRNMMSLKQPLVVSLAWTSRQLMSDGRVFQELTGSLSSTWTFSPLPSPALFSRIKMLKLT